MAGCHEGGKLRSKMVESFVTEAFDGAVLNFAVHSLDLDNWSIDVYKSFGGVRTANKIFLLEKRSGISGLGWAQ